MEIYQIEREDLYSKGRQRIRAEAGGLFVIWQCRSWDTYRLNWEGVSVLNNLACDMQFKEESK